MYVYGVLPKYKWLGNFLSPKNEFSRLATFTLLVSKQRATAKTFIRPREKATAKGLVECR